MSQAIEQTWEQEMRALAEAREARGEVRGEARGQLRMCRRNLREFLEGRFGALPESLIQRIEATEDLELLNAWIHQAARITTLKELQP